MSVLIRAAEPSDYEALRQVYVEPKVISGTLQLPFPSAEKWRKFLAEPAEGAFNLVACADGELVGHLVLQTFPQRPRRRHVGQLAMAVRDDWQGKGVGSALLGAALEMADRWLSLSRLELEVYCDNEAGRKLYEKFGFEVEGRLVHYAFRDGLFVDAFAMARLRPRRESD